MMSIEKASDIGVFSRTRPGPGNGATVAAHAGGLLAYAVDGAVDLRDCDTAPCHVYKVSGSATTGALPLELGESARISGESEVRLRGRAGAQFLKTTQLHEKHSHG